MGKKFLNIIFLSLGWLLLASPALAAEVYLDPAQATFAPGDVFAVKVKLNTQGDCINTAQIAIKFNGPLRLVDFSAANSLLNLWLKRPDSQEIKQANQKQKIVFIGGIPGGYCGVVRGDMGESNILGELFFTAATSSAAKTSAAKIGFGPETKILLHNGQGTAAKLSARAAEIKISPQARPVGNQWQAVIAQDQISPEPFVIELLKNKSMFAGQYYIMFATRDKQSGLDHYEVKEQKLRPFARYAWLKKLSSLFYQPPTASWQRVSAPYVLKDQSLSSLISVKAVDKAGNERVVEYFPEQKPIITNRQWLIISSLLFAFVLAWFVLKIFKHKPYA